MRIMLLPFIALAGVASAAAMAPEPGMQSEGTVGSQSGGVSSTECRDRIEQVREANGLPKLERTPAGSDEALLIAAVDHRIDGCGVMVMRNDTSDIRPVPEPSDRAELKPATRHQGSLQSAR